MSAAASDAAVLDVRGLCTRFHTREGVLPVVDGVSFTLGRGKVLGLVGESGSGKTVTGFSIMRLIDPPGRIEAGEVRFKGDDLTQLAPKALRELRGDRIAMIFQDPMATLNPVLRVQEQMTEAVHAHRRMSGREACALAVAALRMVGIPSPEERLRAYPHQMSGGMRQRVAIAIALLHKPDLIIADEPTTALDVTIQAQILDLLVGLQKETGMALILVTHDMGVVAETAERVIVQYAGQQVERQRVADLFETPRHPYTSALLAALPERSTGGRLPSISGVVPGLHDRPKGCLFNPRCRFASEACRTIEPPRMGHDLGEALCHYPLQGAVTEASS